VDEASEENPQIEEEKTREASDNYDPNETMQIQGPNGEARVLNADDLAWGRSNLGAVGFVDPTHDQMQ